MSVPYFEEITSKVFPELDEDLVPYVASIIEENSGANASELEESLAPILMGHEILSEQEIPSRCKKLVSLLHNKKKKPFVKVSIKKN